VIGTCHVFFDQAHGITVENCYASTFAHNLDFNKLSMIFHHDESEQSTINIFFLTSTLHLDEPKISFIALYFESFG